MPELDHGYHQQPLDQDEDDNRDHEDWPEEAILGAGHGTRRIEAVLREVRLAAGGEQEREPCAEGGHQPCPTPRRHSSSMMPMWGRGTGRSTPYQPWTVPRFIALRTNDHLELRRQAVVRPRSGRSCRGPPPGTVASGTRSRS